MGQRKQGVSAAVVAVDTGVAETPVTFVACIAGPVADVGEGLAEVAKFAFLESRRRIAAQNIIYSRVGRLVLDKLFCIVRSEIFAARKGMRLHFLRGRGRCRYIGS